MKKRGQKRIPPRIMGSMAFLYFLIGIVIIGILALIYSQMLINRIRTEVKRTSTAYAIVSSLLISSKVPQVTQKLSLDIGETMNFPTIVTDVNGNIIAAKNTEVKLDLDDPKSLEKLQEQVKDMGKVNEPIPIYIYYMNPNTKELEKDLMFYFYYKEPPIITLLLWLPLIQISIIIAFLLLGIMSYTNTKRAESDALWVGMAKETAHQIGTPISSLIGWVELLNEINIKNLKEKDRSMLKMIMIEIEKDIKRLKRISDRFGSIGSPQKLTKENLSLVVKRAIEYAKKRFNTEKEGIELRENYVEDIILPLNEEQISWCIENLLKNSIVAMEGSKNKLIDVNIKRVDNFAEISIKDTGSGIEKSNIPYIFLPGFTTKKYSWGLGLSLVKRIVEDLHNGKIRVASRKREGTEFTIVLPIKTDKKTFFRR
ncbi:MAG: ATP-binding protein [bacterium]